VYASTTPMIQQTIINNKRRLNVRLPELVDAWVAAFEMVFILIAPPCNSIFSRMAKALSTAFTVSPDEPFVGSGDIQSLADLGNSYEVVRTMRIAPFTKENIFHLVAATLAPVVPLALTMMPMEELLKMLAGILF